MAAGALAGLAAVLASCGGDASAGGSAGEGAAPGDTVLQRLAEEAVPRVEAASGLEFSRPPKLARSDRDRLEAFLASELDRQLPPGRAEATRDAYARFGLLPDTLDLRALLRSLYLEQVVGYYSAAADTLFVREEVSSEAARPVLVHELVHALQDQHMDLDSLMRARRPSNDALTAALAALEGHATYVMLEDVLGRRSGGDVGPGDLDLDLLLERIDLSEVAGAPELAGAPRVVRESLVFPYSGGLAFVQALWRAREGRPAPLGDDLPASTEQILHPGRFLEGDRDRPVRLTFPDAAEGGWEEVHAGDLGEFEVRLFLEEFLADTARARRAAAGWDGDRYRLLRSEGEEALVWTSVWDSGAEADEFAEAAERAFAARYGARRDGDDRRVRVRRHGVDGRAAVTVTDVPADGDGAAPPPAALRGAVPDGPGR